MAKKAKSAGRSPARAVSWIVTRLTGTPAKYVGRVFAANEADAIKRAIDESKIPAEMHTKLAARRE